MKRQIFLLATLLLIGAGCRETIDESLWPIFSLEGPEGAVVVPPGDLTVSAREIVFADQLVNAKSSAQVITVQNAGSVPVTIISITHSGGEFTQRNNCPVGQLLQLGEICSIEIFFDPTADGVRGGAVQIVDSTSASPRIITLSGRGVVGPSVTSVEVVGADPGIGSNGSGSESDASGSEPPLSPPSEGGGPDGTTTTVEVISPEAQPGLMWSPGELVFDERPVGSTSSYQFALIVNSGEAPLVVSLLRVTGDFGTIDDCPSALGAGESCRVGVKFTPSSSGDQSGELMAYSNASGSPHTLLLSGSGAGSLYPTAELNPSAINFDSVEIDDVCNETDTPPLGSECDGVQATPLGEESEQKEISLWNRGEADLQIESISVDDEFALDNNCGPVVHPNESCDLLVTFVPTTGGSHQGTLTVVSNAPGGNVTATLQGTGGYQVGMVEFELTTYSGLEDEDGLIVNINRTSGTDVETEVTYTIKEGTARAGIDYTGTGHTVIFRVGDYQKSFTVGIEPDLIDEGDETILLQITKATNGATIGSKNQATVTIVDDD